MGMRVLRLSHIVCKTLNVTPLPLKNKNWCKRNYHIDLYKHMLLEVQFFPHHYLSTFNP